MFVISDIFKMISEISAANSRVNIWGAALNIPQLLGGLIFIRSNEGIIILVSVLVTLLVASQIHKRTRFSRLMALCHLPWLLVLPWLLYRLVINDYSLFFQIWMIYVAVTMLISLVLDVNDMLKYFKGAKNYDWKN